MEVRSEMATRKLIELDGRTLEGGGQLLRLSTCLSALTGIPIKITDIRGNRASGGGLKAQHLASVNWLAQACNADVVGAEKGSKTLKFTPTKLTDVSPAYTKSGAEGGGKPVWECRLDIGTAGSTGLALQAILPYILFAPPLNENGELSDLPIRLTVSGGTNVSGSPSYDYISQVLLPTLGRIGFPQISTSLNKRGWSHGGSSIGSFTLLILPRKNLVLPAFSLYPSNPSSKPEQPSTLSATFIAPAHVHDQFRTILTAVANAIFRVPNDTLTINCEESKHEKRYYFLLVATVPTSSGSYVLARDWLYDRKIKSSKRTAAELAERVTKQLYYEWRSGARVDEHMRDQLVGFQALAQGTGRLWTGSNGEGNGENGEEEREISLHARTAEWVATEMLGVKFADGGVDGIGFGQSKRVGELVDGLTKVELS
jgi:RNA 3'-terminal phosphate cyclase (ATP)